MSKETPISTRSRNPITSRATVADLSTAVVPAAVSPADSDSPPKRSSERLLFLDGLRGFASIWILIFHIGKGGQIDELLDWLPGAFRTVINAGWLAVVIFFVLSGFVVDYSLHSKPMSLRFFGHFVAKRSLRLDPPYWASIAITIIVGIASARFKNDLYTIPSPLTVVTHMFYFQDLLGKTPIGEVYWTLALEIQMYLSFCGFLVALNWLKRNLKSTWIEPAAFTVAFILASTYPLGIAEHSTFAKTYFPYAFLFLAGVFISRWKRNPTDRWTIGLLGAQAAVLVVGTVIAHSHTDENARSGFALLTLMAIMAAIRLGKITTWMSGRTWQFLGRVSYSLYLLHVAVLGPLFWLAFKLTGSSKATQAFWFFAATVICIVTAWVFSLIVEQPAMRLSQKVPRFDLNRRQPRHAVIKDSNPPTVG
jgi:peptidoglycan/LPS O-acetylase OafA/YrhL